MRRLHPRIGSQTRPLRVLFSHSAIGIPRPSLTWAGLFRGGFPFMACFRDSLVFSPLSFSSKGIALTNSTNVSPRTGARFEGTPHVGRLCLFRAPFSMSSCGRDLQHPLTAWFSVLGAALSRSQNPTCLAAGARLERWIRQLPGRQAVLLQTVTFVLRAIDKVRQVRRSAAFQASGSASTGRAPAFTSIAKTR